MNRGMTRFGNRIGVWMYRTLDGRMAGPKGVHVLLLTTPGRRSGVPRSTCVRYLETPDGYLVWATASGAPRDPDWFRNLRAASIAECQLGSRQVKVQSRELTGAERDTAWQDVILAQAPGIARYADRAHRTIPVALLKPIEN